ncbi:Exodeoxyribonuclease 10 [compost metagenome]
MVTITGRPALVSTMAFGKYRGKPISEIAEQDPGYLRWMLNNIKELAPDLRMTLKHYLGS